MAEQHASRPRPEALIPRLLELGADPDIDQPDIMSKYPDLCCAQSRIQSLWRRQLNPIMASLTTAELECFLKALAIAELRLCWRRGSVSPVIPVLEEIGQRSPDVGHRLDQWVMRRSTNQWAGGAIPVDMVPLLDQMTHEERETWFLSFTEACHRYQEQAHREKVARVERAEREAERNRQARAQRKAQKRTRDAQRQQTRERLVERGSTRDDTGRLRLLIEHPEVPLDAFPGEWAQVPAESCTRMTREESEQVLARISGKRKGVWRDLCRRIREETD